MNDLLQNSRQIKNWNLFDIMNKDRKVATVYKDGRCTVHQPAFMPYNLYLEEDTDLDARLNNLNNFYYWCSSRLLTLERKYAKEILNSIHMAQATTDKDRAMIAISYHCLSLTDVYWVRFEQEDVSFDQLSLYRHSLSNTFADVSLRGKQMTLQNAALKERDVAGDVGTLGVAPKAWIRREDGFYLYKDGDLRDVKAELLASKIVGCFSVNHVSYEPDVFDGTPVSRCKIITSEKTGIISFEFVNLYCENNDIDSLRFVLEHDRYSFYMMNILDYLIGNTDRHWGNWGFLIDNDTNELTTLYPLMDFNKAFLSYRTEDGTACLPRGGLTQKEAALEAVREIGLNQIAEVDPAWFDSDADLKMFFTRLFILQDALEIAHPPLEEIMARRGTATHSSGTGEITYLNLGGDLTISFDFQAKPDTDKDGA